MKKVGIIAEYNPFHNGHLYMLNKVKELFPDGYLILVLVGNFTQRGDLSVVNKWDKTNIAMNYGFDLVVELPTVFATSSASIYANGAIKTLDKLKCDYLVFGSESNDIKYLKETAVKTIDNKEYDCNLKQYLDKGYNYPKSCSLALKKISSFEIDKPNDILALEYIKSIIRLNSDIKPVSIKRTNDYHDIKIDKEITSASSIRANIDNINLIKKTIPSNVINYIKNISLDNYFNYIKYEIITNDSLDKILDVDEGLENKLKKEIENVNSVDELILKIKSKRYSYNKIKRMLLHILLNIKKNHDKDIKYVRVLGLNNNGSKILKYVKKEINVPIITKFKKEYEELLKEDIKATKIYNLVSKCDSDYRTSIKC